ncbi:HlyD family type I secretion periplasmic adaptor subunit [Arenibaculum pallidiluteum]|uniref:HlyD family type I secretion periplasmic adaptor subunit n=1 Tax=Arenibaculum pallidiluteum TaxID=2812559 RepID=UPI001A9666C5|nr:HlyD family type I secretion periplasmic adaptor subunit [Arenibaculum pallidiluteum]
MSVAEVRDGHEDALTAAARARPHEPLSALVRADRFSPALVEVAERAPTGVVVWLPMLMAVILAAFAGWASFARIDIISSAQGRIVPSARVKLVQPLETGIVRAIHVRNGDRVRAGDPVLELDPTETGVERETLDRRLVTTRLEAAALEAELAAVGGDKAPPTDLFEAAMPTVRALAQADDPDMWSPRAEAELHRTAALRAQLLAGAWTSFRGKVSAAEAEIVKLRAARAATQAQVAKLVAVQPILRERVETRAYLVSRQLTAKSELLELQQALVENEREQDVLRQGLAQAESELGLAEERRRQLLADRREELLRRLSEQDQQITILSADLRKARERIARRMLVAPVDGVVSELSVHTLGGVVKEAEPLLKIVPDDDRLEVEALIPNRDVGFVQPGQHVVVKVDAFPYTRYGSIAGTVQSLSADAMGSSDPSPGAMRPDQTAYKARVALARETMNLDGREIRLIPGMTVVVDIRTGDRTVMEYLLNPVLKYQSEALRER